MQEGNWDYGSVWAPLQRWRWYNFVQENCRNVVEKEFENDEDVYIS